MNNKEVAHLWANQSKPRAKGSNFYFEGPKLYSYGDHFVVGRILPSGTVVMTTQTYSSSTQRHISYARNAIARSKRIVYCHDPDNGPADNKAWAVKAIEGALLAAQTPRRVMEATRLRHRHAALVHAENFNAYLAALPEAERLDNGIEVTPIDTSNLEEVRAQFEEQERKDREAAEERKRQAAAGKLVYLEAWKRGEDVRHSFYDLPIALRLHNGDVETSHGATIPVDDAFRLWPLIQRTMRGERDYEVGMSLGHFRLSKIRRDGSIVVGCHDIAYSEVERIARQLNLLKETA